MTRQTSPSSWEEEMCTKILSLTGDVLYMDFPYFDAALHQLSFVIMDNLTMTATDGVRLYYPSGQIIRLFRKNPVFLQRAYLHSLLHCLFLHPFLRGKRKKPLWNLACDIAVEQLLDTFDRPSVRRILSGIRSSFYRELESENVPPSAAGIYRHLSGRDQEQLKELAAEFITDDHRFWPEDGHKNPRMQSVMQSWQQTAARSRQELEKRGGEQSGESSSLRLQFESARPGRPYADFLRKFTEVREIIRPDPDEFDLAYYTYGLSIYKNMPLIEPLESRETRQIREFVIVIDTSYSTRGSLVRQFLKRTFDILSSGGDFFENSHVIILQCDNKVQARHDIRSKEDLESLFSSFSLEGGGGTDFRPAFSYVDRLRKEGQLTRLRGLLYFTDGQGTYPAAGPDYPTAFLFVTRDPERQLPAWAMKMELDEEDFQ